MLVCQLTHAFYFTNCALNSESPRDHLTDCKGLLGGCSAPSLELSGTALACGICHQHSCHANEHIAVLTLASDCLRHWQQSRPQLQLMGCGLSRSASRTFRIVARVDHRSPVPMKGHAEGSGSKRKAVHLGDPGPSARLHYQVVCQPPCLQHMTKSPLTATPPADSMQVLMQSSAAALAIQS